MERVPSRPPTAFLAAVAVAGSLLWAPMASSATITIGLQQAGVNGGAITPVAVGGGSAAIHTLPYGTFSANTTDGAGRPILPLPSVLDSSSLNVSSTTAGTLTVWITSQNNNDASGTWISSFTSN